VTSQLEHTYAKISRSLTRRNILTLNKSIATNFIAILLIILGYFLIPNNTAVFNTGLFAFSGAITNWLAIHMLFEKVPFLYGSGVIPNQFEKFRAGIRTLIMDQFFTSNYLSEFLENNAMSWMPDFDSAIDGINYNELFDKLIEAISESSLGSMLTMVGGIEALEPLREPVIKKMKKFIAEFVKSKSFHQKILSSLKDEKFSETLYANINEIVEQRLKQLTPQLVKDMVQQMIRQHLGWLVVWGGLFGGLIGLIYTLVI